jgi:hypothetical protein
MAIFLFTNNAASTLAAAIGPASTTIQLATGTGVLFPAPAAGQQFALTLNDLATRTAFEVVYCTARSGDTLTVLRGQEGTTALSWVIGDLCWNGPTSGTMASFVQTQHMTDGTISPVFNTGTFNGAVGVTNQATITGTTAAGATLAMRGNGATTPNKFIRVLGGVLQVVNSAFTAVIATLSDLGDLTGLRNIGLSGTISGGTTITASSTIQSTAGQVIGQTGVQAANGNVTANSGRLRATFGYSSSDGNAAVLGLDVTNGGGWTFLPNGLVLQWGSIGAVAGAGPVAFSLARTWPNATPAMIVISYESHNNPPTGSIGADFNTAANGQAVYQNTAASGTHGCYWWAIGS